MCMAIEQVEDLIDRGGKRGIRPDETTKELCLELGREDKVTRIGTKKNASTELGLTTLLRKSLDVFHGPQRTWSA